VLGTAAVIVAAPSAKADDSPAAEAPAPAPEAEENPVARGLVWGGTTAEVAVLTSMVLEVGVFPPVQDNGPRLLLLTAGSVALGVGVGWLAAALDWPEQWALGLHGAAWGAFVLAPFGMLIDGARDATDDDGVTTGTYTAMLMVGGAVFGGLLGPLLLDVHESTETGAFYAAPGLGALLGTIVWLGLWLFGGIPDEPRTSSQALVAAAGIGGTLGFALPFVIRAAR
jgi:hypothetical protein